MEVDALQPPTVEPLDAFSNAGKLDDEDERLPSTQQGQQVNEQLLQPWCMPESPLPGSGG